MVIKNAKHAESNTNIPSPVLNMQVLKMYSIQIKFGHFGHFLVFSSFFLPNMTRQGCFMVLYFT